MPTSHGYGSSRSTITTATVRRNPPLCRLAHWWRTPQHHQRRLRSTANTKLLSPERCPRHARSGARGVYFLDSAMALPGKTPNDAGLAHPPRITDMIFVFPQGVAASAAADWGEPCLLGCRLWFAGCLPLPIPPKNRQRTSTSVPTQYSALATGAADAQPCRMVYAHVARVVHAG